MILNGWGRYILIGLLTVQFPRFAYSVDWNNKAANHSAVAGGLLFFGACLMISGAMIVKNQKIGPEEGLRGTTIKGKNAERWGLIQIILGVILIVLGISA
jgi:hypothetical protein